MLKHTAGPSHACTRHFLNGSTQFQASSAAQLTTPEAQLHKPAISTFLYIYKGPRECSVCGPYPTDHHLSV